MNVVLQKRLGMHRKPTELSPVRLRVEGASLTFDFFLSHLPLLIPPEKVFLCNVAQTIRFSFT